MEEIWRQQWPEDHMFTAVARTRTLNIFSSIYIVEAIHTKGEIICDSIQKNSNSSAACRYVDL